MGSATSTSKNTTGLKAVRDQVVALRDMAFTIIANRDTHLDDSDISSCLPEVRDMYSMLTDVGDNSDSEHGIVVINSLFTAMQDFESQNDLCMLSHNNLKGLQVILESASAYNAQATLKKVNAFLDESEHALDGGILRSEHIDDINSMLNRIINVECSLATIDTSLSTHDTPPRLRHKV